ncbi:cation transporter [Shimia haliotis]|uniref:Divalent metal cation (Fe/Co/Zn/Cd) transporter n=1 Tax=Shimia haliotis TaxID=1280847 RepID=A0A1I4DPI7_9RHOB|nr:cation transporter [Shimia haliotis]SFK93871.1 Divalent metal cation (Fe/Co/Zn/Cd) transporter [Shimia haliotis]
MHQNIEKRAIIVAAVLGMVMALSGWLAYYLSGSEALLLDGNFSFIGVVATLAALKISSVKTQTSKTYPFGKFVFEATYSLFIGILTVGVIIAAVTENISKIMRYTRGETFPVVDASIILVYTIAMVVICFGLAFYFRAANRKLNGTSTILGAYTVQSGIDGLMSLGAGVTLVAFSTIDPAGEWGFLTQIGDALLVITLCALVLYQPIGLIRSSFIEMSGGALGDKVARDDIRTKILAQVPEDQVEDMFISKTGSAFLAVAFVSPEFFDAHSAAEQQKMRADVMAALTPSYPHLGFDFVMAPDVKS